MDETLPRSANRSKTPLRRRSPGDGGQEGTGVKIPGCARNCKRRELRPFLRPLLYGERGVTGIPSSGDREGEGAVR